MARTFLLSLSLLLISGSMVRGASWYVDNAATGSNNGTSWANAWKNPAGIVWSSVNPGDTVFVSGGTTTKIYTNSLVIGKNGTTGNYIKVRIGQDAGHNGVAVFSNAVIHPNGSRPNWNWIDGARNPSFVAPTNHQQVGSGATAITNNIGFVIKDIVGTNNSDTSPAGIYLRGPNNTKFSWIEYSGFTNTGNFAYHETRGSVGYIDQGSESVASSNVVFEYLHLKNNQGQQFGGAGGPASGSGFDEFVFKFMWVEYGGEDHWEGPGGYTVRDSIIGPQMINGVHNDFFQFTGSNVKIYNNDIRESQNAILRIQSYSGLTHDVWFYNNLVTEKRGRAPGGGTLVEGIAIVHFDPLHPAASVTFSNIIFANNLFFNSELSTIVEPDEMARNPMIFWDKGEVTNAYVVSNLFVNNLVVNKHKGATFPASTNVAGIGVNGGYEPFTTNDFMVNYNVFAGTNRDVGTISNVLYTTRISYMDVLTNADLHPYKFLNITNFPVFVDAANDNFELLSTDTAALNNGLNLSQYFTTDALNRPRNVGGTWDKGPLEAQGSVTVTAPTSFTLVSPAAGATNQSPTLTLGWAASGGAVSYQVEMDTDSGFSAPVVHSATAYGTSYAVPSGVLGAGTAYYWRVRAVNSAGSVLAVNAPFSLVTGFVSVPVKPAMLVGVRLFTLVSPTQGSSGVPSNPSLLWTDASGETSYTVEIDDEPEFLVPLVHIGSVSANILGYAVPTGVLATNSHYYWRVRAVNGTGLNVLATGAPWEFTTQFSSTNQEVSGPLVWLRFEDDFSDSTLDDSSGNGNHAHRFGRPGSVAPTNFPIRVAASATAGTNISTYAGDFYWNANSDGYGFGRDGAYGAITNVAAFTNLSRATIAVRARYSSTKRINSTYDYSQDGNAALIVAGTSSGNLGGWGLQRYNSAIWLNNTRFMLVTNSDFGVSQVGSSSDRVFGKAGKAIFNFPDRGYDNNGDTTNWHHYAVTFNQGVIVTYFDGVPLVTNDVSAAVTRLTVGMNGSVSAATGFIGIGCDTHDGTPALENETGTDYPNHGFFNGQMDDVMIYDRALSAAEIRGIAAGH